MYILDEGCLEIHLQAGDGRKKTVISTKGAPVGEIGFLRGTPSIADVLAITKTLCLRIDDDVLQKLNSDHPETAAKFLRSLVKTLEGRQSYNLSLFGGVSLLNENPDVKMLLCRDEDLKRKAYRLRYEVYCEELERTPSAADHKARLFSDDLDEFGHTFIAAEGDQVVGSVRANRPIEGNLGPLVDLYGMDKSDHHPATTAIVTKLVVIKSHRKTSVAMSMIAAICRYGVQQGITEIYIDSIPQLLHYYRAMGFSVSNEQFLHPDNGLSIPLKIDFAKYGVILGREPTKIRLLKILIAAKYHKLIGPDLSFVRPLE